MILFFLPIGLDRAYRRFPIATLFLCALNLVVYGALAGWPFLTLSSLVVENFALFPHSATFFKMLSAMFINVDIVHVLLNVVFLWVFGPVIEEELGTVFFLVLFLVGGMAAALAQIGVIHLLLPGDVERPIAGASGAVSCVLGMFAVRYSYSRVRVFYSYWLVVFARSGVAVLSAWAGIGLWLALQVALGGVDVYLRHSSGVGHFAHLAAFGIGAGIAALGGMAGVARQERRRAQIEADMREGPLGEAHAAEVAVMAAPEDHRRQLDAGRAWAKLDDREKASEHYTKAVSLAVVAGDRALAIEAFDAAHDDGVGLHLTTREKFALANGLMEEGRFAEASDLFMATYQSDEPSAEKPVALLRTAQIYLERLKRPEDGERLLRRFIAEYEGDEWEAYARTLLADAEKRRGTGIGSTPRPLKGPR